MSAEFADVNWLAVIVGTVVAFGLGMIWFSPIMFGKRWSAGMGDLQPPSTMPVAAMILQLLGTFLLALIVGVTATQDALITAIVAILAVGCWQMGSALFKQKAGSTVLIDGGYIIASGLIMIIFQGIF